MSNSACSSLLRKSSFQKKAHDKGVPIANLILVRSECLTKSGMDYANKNLCMYILWIKLALIKSIDG